jgi:hypothetical protein
MIGFDLLNYRVANIATAAAAMITAVAQPSHLRTGGLIRFPIIFLWPFQLCSRCDHIFPVPEMASSNILAEHYSSCATLEVPSYIG